MSARKWKDFEKAKSKCAVPTSGDWGLIGPQTVDIAQSPEM